MEEAFSLGLEAGGAEEEGIISGKEQPDRKKRLSGYRPAEDSTIRLSACVWEGDGAQILKVLVNQALPVRKGEQQSRTVRVAERNS